MDFTAPPSGASIVIPAWDQAGTISIATIADTVDESDAPETLQVSLGTPTNASLGSPTIATGTISDDPFEISPRNLQVTEGGSGTFEVALGSQPSVAVSVAVSGAAGSDLTVSGAPLSFTTGNWATAQTITVAAGEDDDGLEDSVSLTLTATAAGDSDYDGATATVIVNVTDNDAPNLVVNPSMLSVAENDTASFSLDLATRPSETVTVSLSSGDTDLVAVTPASLTFTTGDWDDPQTVTVRGVDDDDASTDSTTITARVTASGADYLDKQAQVTVQASDDDTPALILLHNGTEAVPELIIPEELAVTGLEVVLATRPTATVTVSASSDDPDAVAGPSTPLTFMADDWDTPQTLALRSLDDVDSGDEMVTVTLLAAGGGYENVAVELAVTVLDDDGPYLDVSPTLVVDEDSTADIRLRLGTQPSGDVAVSALSGDLDLATVRTLPHNFDTMDWNSHEVWTVIGHEDDNAVDDTAVITFTASGADYEGETVTVTRDSARP